MVGGCEGSGLSCYLSPSGAVRQRRRVVRRVRIGGLRSDGRDVHCGARGRLRERPGDGDLLGAVGDGLGGLGADEAATRSWRQRNSPPSALMAVKSFGKSSATTGRRRCGPQTLRRRSPLTLATVVDRDHGRVQVGGEGDHLRVVGVAGRAWPSGSRSSPRSEGFRSR